MEKRDSTLDDMYQELAERFGTLSQLFGELNSPDATQSLIESLTSRDPATFKQLTDRVNIPMLGKCFWVREVIESVMCDFAGFVQEWRLRDNLTTDENLTYIRIVARHRPLKKVMADLTLSADPTVIPAGPFLDELKANGLVTPTNRSTWDCSIKAVLAPPEKFCI